MSFMRIQIVAAVVAFASVAVAENAFGPMAVGGVAREAENRAVSSAVPVRSADAARTPSVSADGHSEAAKTSVDSGRTLGPVKAVRFYGSTAFAEREALADQVLEALGEGSKTVGDVLAALAEVRRAEMKKGYYLVRFSVFRSKPYDAATQTLAVLVDEGHFGAVNVSFADDGGYWYSPEQIYRRFREIESGDTFDYNRLRGVLSRVNSHPDITVDTRIRTKTTTEGEGDDRRISRNADIELTVHESCPLHAMFEVNNYGMEEVNEWQTAMTLQYLNLTKHDDVLTLSPMMSVGCELLSMSGSYMLPHEWLLGGNTSVYGGWTYLDVDEIVDRLDLEGSGWFAGIQHSENIYETDAHVWSVTAGLLWRYLSDEFNAAGYKLGDRELGILPISLGLNYAAKRPDALGGRNFLTVQGICNLMTSDDIDKMTENADKHYWAFRGQAARIQPVFDRWDATDVPEYRKWTIFAKLEGQYTADSLIPVERLALGGYNAMRGYRTRAYMGDYGGYGTVEFRTPWFLDPVSSFFGKDAKSPIIDRWQFLAFCDFGCVAYNEPLNGMDRDVFICSAGVGGRFALAKNLSMKCDLAVPFNDTDWADDHDFEAYFGVQLQF